MVSRVLPAGVPVPATAEPAGFRGHPHQAAGILRSWPARTTCVVWSSRSQAITGGLQRQIDRLAAEVNSLRLGVAVVSPPDDLPRAGPGSRLEVAHYRTSHETVASLAATAAVVYCARLYKGLERAQVPALLRLSEQVPVVVRCPTTDDARRLRAAVLAVAATHRAGQGFVVHCLNRRSAERLRDLRDLGVRPVVSGNTARPRPLAVVGETAPPAEAAVLYCGRADRSKNLDGLLAAWSLVPTDRRLQLFGPEPLRRLASRRDRVVYRGRYDGDPPFRLGDVVVLPSFREGHSNVLVEAFRAGAVVVGSAVPGVEEHLRDGLGIVIDRPLRARSIAAALAAALALTPRQRLGIGLRARAHFDTHLASPYSSAVNVLRAVLT
jgi:glycosyltransferase involved in cell wall biosynthesis